MAMKMSIFFYIWCLVTLQADGDSDFRGYMIQACSGTETTGLGSWDVEGSQGKSLNCPGGSAVSFQVLKIYLLNELAYYLNCFLIRIFRTQ